MTRIYNFTSMLAPTEQQLFLIGEEEFRVRTDVLSFNAAMNVLKRLTDGVIEDDNGNNLMEEAFNILCGEGSYQRLLAIPGVTFSTISELLTKVIDIAQGNEIEDERFRNEKEIYPQRREEQDRQYEEQDRQQGAERAQPR